MRQTVFILALSLILLSACAPISKPGQTRQQDFVVLSRGRTIGQTFVARYAGLTAIEVMLVAKSTKPGSVILHLREDSLANADIISGEVLASEIRDGKFTRIPFPPQKASNQKYYYFYLEVTLEGNLDVSHANGQSYLDGAMYINHEPRDAQLSFRLDYDPVLLGLGLMREGITWIWYLLVAGFLYVFPGWGLLCMLWNGWSERHWVEKLALSTGLSLALYPVLLLWMDVAGLHWGKLFVWGFPLLGLGLILLRNLEKIRAFHWHSKLMQIKKCTNWPDLAFLAVMGLIFFSRFWAIRSLEAPLWGDSVHHAMIAQLLVDNGGLFESWTPYVPYTTFTVHFGFHTIVAMWKSITGTGILESTLVAGQVLNGLAILTLYPLARRFSEGNRWVGVGVLLVAGLLSPMPAFYVNWGRYAQLAGQAVLPVALWFLWEMLSKVTDNGKGSHMVKRACLMGLVIVGMALGYYRMPFYFACFVLVFMGTWALPRFKFNGRAWLAGVSVLALAACLSLLLFLPWGLNLRGANLAEFFSNGVSNGALKEAVIADFHIWKDIKNYVPPGLLVISGLGFLWGVFRRKWIVVSIPAWIGLICLYNLGSLIRLPGANMLQNFSILISLYIPVGLLAGWFIGECIRWVDKWNKKYLGGLIALFLVCVSLAGAWKQRSLLDTRSFAMVTRPDIRAMEWVRTNVPVHSRFFVQGFRIYEGTSAVGADAGWWIPLLTGRQNTMPPQYALVNEQSDPVNYSQRVVDLVANLENVDFRPGGIAYLREMEVTHIYDGQRRGLVGTGVNQLFDTDSLVSDPFFKFIYRQDRVRIFKLVPQGYGGSN